MRRLLLVALALAVSAGAVGAAFTLRARATPTPAAVTLQTASASSLDGAGIRLTTPSGSPAIDGEAASQAAIARFPGSVREAVLAQVEDRGAVPALHCLCWVISVYPRDGLQFPSGGPSGNTNRQTPAYWLVIVDASSGKPVDGVASSAP
jgi:hypothetical protein